MADQLLTADDERKAEEDCRQEVRRRSRQEPTTSCNDEDHWTDTQLRQAALPAAQLAQGNEKLRELFIKGKKKGQPGVRRSCRTWWTTMDLDGDQMDQHL